MILEFCLKVSIDVPDIFIRWLSKVHPVFLRHHGQVWHSSVITWSVKEEGQLSFSFFVVVVESDLVTSQHAVWWNEFSMEMQEAKLTLQKQTNRSERQQEHWGLIKSTVCFILRIKTKHLLTQHDKKLCLEAPDNSIGWAGVPYTQAVSPHPCSWSRFISWPLTLYCIFFPFLSDLFPLSLHFQSSLLMLWLSVEESSSGLDYTILSLLKETHNVPFHKVTKFPSPNETSVACVGNRVPNEWVWNGMSCSDDALGFLVCAVLNICCSMLSVAVNKCLVHCSSVWLSLIFYIAGENVNDVWL